MGTSFAFGTYIPGASWVHKTNAQVKIVLACVLSIVAFFVKTWAGLGFLILCTLVLYALSHVNVSNALRGLKPVIFILAFTIIAHTFTVNVFEQQTLNYWQIGSLGLPGQFAFIGTFGVTADGFVCGLFFALRIALLVAACSLLSFTTSIAELTDGLVSLLSPLGKLKVPVQDLAMIISIALRFIPVVTREAFDIVDAQKARCGDFDSPKFASRVKAWFPVFVPLFVRLFKRADELAQAMDARCYKNFGRTKMKRSAFKAADAICGGVFCLVFVATAVFL